MKSSECLKKECLGEKWFFLFIKKLYEKECKRYEKK